LVELERITNDDSEATYNVLVEGIIIGRVERHKELGRNLVKSFVVSGSDYDGRTRRARLWTAVVDYHEIDDQERRLVQHHVTRTKTNRHDAAKHLLAAFDAAGIPLPVKRAA
jgi:hypothetical protein